MRQLVLNKILHFLRIPVIGLDISDRTFKFMKLKVNGRIEFESFGEIDIPAGVIEEGESPEDAARRKAMVELGLEVESLRPLGPQATITSRVYNVTHSFLARIQEGSQPARPRSGDAISLAAFPFAEVMDMVRSRVINTAIIAADLWTINDLINRGRVSLRPTS